MKVTVNNNFMTAIMEAAAKAGKTIEPKNLTGPVKKIENTPKESTTANRVLDNPSSPKLTPRKGGDPMLKDANSILQAGKALLCRDTKNASTCNALLLHAESLKEARASLLMQNKAHLGADFANLDREQFIKKLEDVPLGKLPANIMGKVTELRNQEQFCLNKLNAEADLRDRGTLNLAATPLHKEIAAFLDRANQDFANLEKVLPNTIFTSLQRIFDNIKNNTPANETDITTVGAYIKDNKNLPNAHAPNMISNFRAFASLVASFQKLNTFMSTPGKETAAMNMMVDMGLSVYDETGNRLRGAGIKFRDFLLDVFGGKANRMDVVEQWKTTSLPLYTSPRTDTTPLGTDTATEKATNYLKDILGKPGKKSETELHTAVWKLGRELRFNPALRITLGLVGNPTQLLKDIMNDYPNLVAEKSMFRQKMLHTLGQYMPKISSVKKELARGGAGVVSLGKLTQGEKNIIIKQLINQHAQADLIKEAIMQAITQGNKNIPDTLGVCTVDGNLALVIEAIPGKDLGKMVGNVSSSDPDDKLPQNRLLHDMPVADRAKVATHMVGGLIRGLAPLHAAGLAHNDTKPDNLILDENTLEARLIDFGIVTSMGEVSGGTEQYADTALNAKFVTLDGDIYTVGTTYARLLLADYGFSETDQSFAATLANPLWEQHAVLKDAKEVITLLTNPAFSARPTMEQLYAIVDGRDVPPAKNGIGASPDTFALLQRVLGPEGTLAGGKTVLAQALSKTTSPETPNQHTETQNNA